MLAKYEARLRCFIFILYLCGGGSDGDGSGDVVVEGGGGGLFLLLFAVRCSLRTFSSTPEIEKNKFSPNSCAPPLKYLKPTVHERLKIGDPVSQISASVLKNTTDKE